MQQVCQYIYNPLLLAIHLACHSKKSVCCTPHKLLCFRDSLQGIFHIFDAQCGITLKKIKNCPEKINLSI